MSAAWPNWLSHCLLTGWTKEASAPENERGDKERQRHERYRSDGIGAVPGEKSIECQCRVGPSVNVSLYELRRGRGQRRGRNGNDATLGTANNDGKSGCQHKNKDLFGGRSGGWQHEASTDNIVLQ